MSRAAFEREVRRRNHEQAVASAKALAGRLERGDDASAMYRGSRVRCLREQVHPEVGPRTAIQDGPLVFWVLDAELSDKRGAL